MPLIRLLGCAALSLSACDHTTPAPIDLDGPRGQVQAPGPWPVRVFVSDATAEILAAVDDGPFVPVGLARTTDEGQLGLLPDAPVGSTVRYYARVGSRTEPSGGAVAARQLRVVPVRAPADPAPPGACRLSFRWPTDGLRLSAADDDAPQAGVQITVILETNLVDAAPARLDVEGRGYSGQAGAGVVAFANVTVPQGGVELVAEATPDGGTPCRARIRVSRT